MVYWILIRGPASVGKTTIGKKLATKIKGECIHLHKIIKKYNLGYIIGEKWIPEKNFFKVNKIAIPEMNKKLKSGKVMIIEGNFYHKSQIEDLLKKIPYQNFSFTLKADLKECIRRDKNRKTTIGPKRISDVFRLVARFDYGIDIDTNNKIPTEIVEEVIKYLPKSE